MKSFFFIVLQYIGPQHLISRLAGGVANTKVRWLKNFLIRKFIAAYGVDMDEAENSDPSSYRCFNDFFCRALQPNARPIVSGKNAVACPADGVVSQLGTIEEGRIFQAKNRHYDVFELVGGDQELSAHFAQGEFATIYLSPRDYHRLHMPIDGTLIFMRHIPGDLFSVNPTTTERVPRLFARNERVVCVFDTAIGKVALVLVGAMIVASIETVWAGQIAPIGEKITTFQYHELIRLNKGEELGRFKLGSTVIMLFPQSSLSWQANLKENSPVKMGQLAATLTA